MHRQQSGLIIQLTRLNTIAVCECVQERELCGQARLVSGALARAEGPDVHKLGTQAKLNTNFIAVWLLVEFRAWDLAYGLLTLAYDLVTLAKSP